MGRLGRDGGAATGHHDYPLGYAVYKACLHLFPVERIARDQVEDYARRRGITGELAEKYLRANIGY